MTRSCGWLIIYPPSPPPFHAKTPHPFSPPLPSLHPPNLPFSHKANHLKRFVSCNSCFIQAAASCALQVLFTGAVPCFVWALCSCLLPDSLSEPRQATQAACFTTQSRGWKPGQSLYLITGSRIPYQMCY